MLDQVERLRDDIFARRIGRRAVLQRATVLGLSAPLIAGLLAACGSDDDDPTATTGAIEATNTTASGQGEPTATTSGEAEPTASAAPDTPSATPDESGDGPGRGSFDQVRILYWQAPTILNTHFAQGDKDSSAARLVLEPLIEIDRDGNLIPVLAAEVPSLENGGVAADGMSVTYTLREGVVWSDGEPFTSADVRFTWEYITHPDSSATSVATYMVIEDVEIVDDYTVTVHFAEPNPAWFNPFSSGYGGTVMPMHLLSDAIGVAARDAPFNLHPIGTGPYTVVDFNPGDVVSYEMNESFRDPNKPHFARAEIKGGGDATSAARAAMLTGEVDYAWNLQVEAEILEQMSQEATTGELLITPGPGVERILVNLSNPNLEVDGERSKLGEPHPFLSDVEVRRAFTYVPDRDTIASQLYGPAGEGTANTLVSPPAFTSPNTSYEYNLDTAAAAFDAAGWVVENDIRQKDGVEMRMLYSTSSNPVRQKTQEIIKEAAATIGIEIEIKAVDAGVFFSSDAGNPDTWAHFYADWQMFTNSPASPHPIDYMANYKSNEPETDIPQQSNSWSGANAYRWISEDYNALYEQAVTELDAARQAELFIEMNDLIVSGDGIVEIPLVHRAGVAAIASALRGLNGTPWSPATWNVEDWYFEE